MTVPDPMAARASLEIARVAFESMTAASDPSGTLAADVSRASSVGSAEPLTMAVRAQGAWNAARQMLQQMTGRADLDGQPLVAEARRLQQLSLDDAHALVALHSWTERATAPGSAAQSLTMAPTSAEQTVAREALSALERAVGAVTAPSQSNAASSFAPPAAPASFAQPSSAVPDAVATAAWTPRQQPASPPSATAYGAVPKILEPTRPREDLPSASEVADKKFQPRSRSGIWTGIAIGIVIVAAGAALWYAINGRSKPASSAYADGVAAYQAGALEIARQAFARVAQENPNDVNSLIYLGRIARESGDIAQSRRFLDNAIRVAPNNALALREMGSSLLADNEPELARRFYVHALQFAPDDKPAQGFLGCALIRLRRVEEAQRWLSRAGQGEWTQCASTLPPSSP